MRRRQHHARSASNARAHKGLTGSPPARETTLRQVVEKYQALLKALPDLMFVLRRDGTYTDYWAEHHEGELAFPSSEIIGHTLKDTGFSEKDLKRIFAQIELTLDTGEPGTLEYGLETQDGYGHFEARIVRVNSREVLSIVRNITDRKEAEEKLKDTSKRLAAETRELTVKNVALEQVLRHIENEQRVYRHQLNQEISDTVLPLLERLKANATPAQAKDLERLESEVNATLSTNTDAFWKRYASLTPREMELCELLKEGLSSKQMSDRLNVSLATIHKHREQIRRKLGFQGKRVNLGSFLRLHATPGRT